MRLNYTLFYRALMVFILVVCSAPLAANAPVLAPLTPSVDTSSLPLTTPAPLLHETEQWKEKITKHILELTDILQKEIFGLSAALNKGTFVLPNKAEIIQELATIQQLITFSKTPLYKSASPIELIRTLQIVQFFTQLLSDWIAKGCKNSLNLESLEQFITRATLPIIDETFAAEVEKEITAVKKQLTTLEKKAQLAGLSLFKRFFRKVNSSVVHPITKYKIPTLTAKVTATAAILAMHIWLADPLVKNTKLGTNTIWQSTVNRINNLVGPAPSYNDTLTGRISTFAPNNAKKLGYIGSLYHLFNAAMHGHMLAPSLLSLGTLGLMWRSEAIAIKDGIKYALAWVSHKLRGEKMKGMGIVEEVQSTITFDDVIGYESYKEYFREVIKYVIYPERFDRTDTGPSKGILMYGVPGSGKTYTMHATKGEMVKELIAAGRAETDVKVLLLSASHILRSQLGFIDVIAYAQYYAPCILFIDEFDLLLPTRSENTLVVADILTHMNGIVDSDPKNRYIIVGATNRIECIDAAIKRSGRFGKHMRFEKPNVKERAEFLTKRLAGLALNPNDFDIDRLAEETEGKTFEDLANAIRSAMRKVQTSSTPFNQELLEKFIDTDVRGIIESEHSIDPMQQRVVAVHLAGHVLAYELLNARERVSRVTTHSIQMGVKERMQWQATMETTKQEPLVRGGIFTYTPQGTLAAKSMVDMINEAKIHLAGHMAETILMGTTYDYHAGHNGEVNDRNTAYAIALNLATGQVDMAQLSETQQNKLRDSAFEIMHKWEQEVSILLAENKVALTKLADALTERHTLSNKEINELVNSPSDRTISDERADELLAELLNTKPLLKKATA